MGGGVDLSTQGPVSDGLSVGDRDADYANVIGVRGPESSGYDYIASSGDLRDIAGGGEMYVDSSARPDQAGVDFRSFRLTLDANNQLTVEMKFGSAGDWIEAFNADLSSYDRPETFKIGFTGGTGGAWATQEVRNVSVAMTPWQPDAFEWDNDAGTTDWGTAANWVGDALPTTNADILFGDKPPSGPQTAVLDQAMQLNSITFDSDINYTVAGEAITLGNTATNGLPSINVNAYNDANARHKINNDLTLAEKLRINNYSFSSLCLNGELDTAGNDIAVNGYGAVNFNGDILGSGDLVKNGSGIVTINNNNADGGTPWTGDVIINKGQVVVTADGALGAVSSSTEETVTTYPTVNTTVNQWGELNKFVMSDAAVAAAGLQVGMHVTGPNLPPGTTITGFFSEWGTTHITLSNSVSTWSGGQTYTFTDTANPTTTTETVTTIHGTTVNAGGALTFRGGVNYATQEAVSIAGRGVELGTGGDSGAIYNDGGDNSFAGPILLAADAAVGSRDGVLTLSGVIDESGGSRSLTKVGAGVVSLTGTNTYTGNTVIENGALRVTTDSLPGGYDTDNTGSNFGAVELAGGVLELASDVTFTRRLGTGEEQIFWTGDGGFSAFGGDRTVSLTNAAGVANGQLTWNQGHFVPTGNALLLSSDYADGMLTLTNAIALGSEIREIRVANGSAAVDGRLTGVLSGAGGIDKTGAGTLFLDANNSYTGATRISEGALRVGSANRINGSNLQLNGGVLEVGFNFSRDLGGGGSDVQWLGDGGFAAYGGARTITLGTGMRTWGEANFVGLDNRLVFGSVSADNTARLTNALELGEAGTRTIHTVQGTNTAVASGTLSGVVSGSANLAVTGDGRLDLTANNSHTGGVVITGAEVRLSGSGRLDESSGFVVREGGTLTLDNSATRQTDRVGNDAGVTLDGGTLAFIGRNSSSGTVDITEQIGAVVLAGGANTIDLTRRNSEAHIRLEAASLTREAGATVDFTNTGGTLGGAGDNDSRVSFSSAPTLDDGILAYATVNGSDFATHGVNGIAAATYAANNLAQESWNSSVNHTADAASTTLTASRNLNSVRLVDGADFNLGAHQLSVESGGVLTTGAGGTVISGGLLTTNSANQLVVHAYNTGGTTISSVIGGNGGLVKTGAETLTLAGSSANTNTGTTYVNAGTLVLAKDAGVTAIAGDLVVGDGRGSDVVEFVNDEQIADTADVTLAAGATLRIGDTTQTFDTLTVIGDSILDFSGGDPCGPAFLRLSDIDFMGDATLTIRNWIEFTDFILVESSATIDFARITFEGYGGEAQWQDYSSGWKQLTPVPSTGVPGGFTPVPEPAEAGALLVGGCLSLVLLRRRHRRTIGRAG